MTDKEFGELIPGMSVLKYKGKKCLFKFFCCRTDDYYDGYWICATYDFSNPHKSEIMGDDIQSTSDDFEVVSF